MKEYGVMTDAETLRMERLLPGPIERVWDYLTLSEKRAKWFAAGDMDLRTGGKVTFKFHHADLSDEKEVPERFKAKVGRNPRMDGEITSYEPPHRLSFLFGKSGEVTFELTPKGKDVLLVLTHRRLPDRDTALSVAGGWHAHLDILADNLKGEKPRPFWTTIEQREAYYAARI